MRVLCSHRGWNSTGELGVVVTGKGREGSGSGGSLCWFLFAGGMGGSGEARESEAGHGDADFHMLIPPNSTHPMPSDLSPRRGALFSTGEKMHLRTTQSTRYTCKRVPGVQSGGVRQR